MPLAPTDLLGKRGAVLFHYTSLERAIEDILPSMTLKTSPFAEMRDPRESKDWGPTTAGFTDSDNHDAEDRRYWELYRCLNDLKRSCRLLSFTEDDPDPMTRDYGRGFARPRLWEQYGGAHKGICLCFDRAALIRSMEAEFSGDLFFRHGAVEYLDERLFRELSFDASVLAESIDLESIIAKHLETHWKSFFFTKLTDWSTEREYRFLLRRLDPAAVFVDMTDSLRAICMGPDLADPYYPALAALCAPSGIHVRKLIWQNNEPLTMGIQIESPAAITPN